MGRRGDESEQSKVVKLEQPWKAREVEKHLSEEIGRDAQLGGLRTRREKIGNCIDDEKQRRPTQMLEEPRRRARR